MSAKALGAMVKGMGETCFDDLLPWLMETLASEQSSVDRSGAAQGESGSVLLHCTIRGQQRAAAHTLPGLEVHFFSQEGLIITPAYMCLSFCFTILL